jgi:hypothetical protein
MTKLAPRRAEYHQVHMTRFGWCISGENERLITETKFFPGAGALGALTWL